MIPTSLSANDFLKVAQTAEEKMEQLQEKYPELKIQAMFSLQGCQTKLTTDILIILKHLPEMIYNDELKRSLRLYYRDRALIKREDPNSPQIVPLTRNIELLEKQLWFKGITRIDLKILCPSPELIQQLFRDPLVDQSLSFIQKSGAARISLGTLSSLARTPSKL